MMYVGHTNICPNSLCTSIPGHHPNKVKDAFRFVRNCLVFFEYEKGGRDQSAKEDSDKMVLTECFKTFPSPSTFHLLPCTHTIPNPTLCNRLSPPFSFCSPDACRRLMIDDAEISSDQLVFKRCSIRNHNLVTLGGDKNAGSRQTNAFAKPHISRNSEMVQLGDVGN